MKIRKALSRRITFDIEDTPLEELARFFQEELDVNVQFDKRALDEAGIGISELVTASSSNVSARSALDISLRNLEVPLTWIIDYEMLLITTLEEANARMTVKIYDISDLVLARTGKNESDFDRMALIEVIIRACDEEALWLPLDGEGGVITYDELPGHFALVVRQTRNTHEEIEVLLAGLRRQRRKQPSFFMNTRTKKKPVPHGSGASF